MFQFRKLFGLLILLPFFFGSCFEITEEVYVAADGTGNAVITVNMSESKKNIANFMKMKQIDGITIPKKEDLAQLLLEVKQSLSSAKGIRNVQYTSDFEEYVFSFTGDFDAVENLNQAINKVAEDLNKSPYPTIKRDNFAFVKNSFVRYFKYKFSAKNYKKLSIMQKMLAEAARFVGIYRFEKQIKHFSNDKAIISPNRKAIKIEHSLADILTGASSIENTIKF